MLKEEVHAGNPQFSHHVRIGLKDLWMIAIYKRSYNKDMYNKNTIRKNTAVLFLIWASTLLIFFTSIEISTRYSQFSKSLSDPINFILQVILGSDVIIGIVSFSLLFFSLLSFLLSPLLIFLKKHPSEIPTEPARIQFQPFFSISLVIVSFIFLSSILVRNLNQTYKKTNPIPTISPYDDSVLIGEQTESNSPTAILPSAIINSSNKLQQNYVSTNNDPLVLCRGEKSGQSKKLTTSQCQEMADCEFPDRSIIFMNKDECVAIHNELKKMIGNQNNGSGTGKIHCSYMSSNGKYQYDYGDLTFSECTAKSSGYWTSQKMAIPANTYPITQSNQTQSIQTSNDNSSDKIDEAACRQEYQAETQAANSLGGSARDAVIEIATQSFYRCLNTGVVEVHTIQRPPEPTKIDSGYYGGQY